MHVCFSDISRQFYQHFTAAFFVQNFGAKKHVAFFWFEILEQKILYEKCARKMLMKLTPGGTLTPWVHEKSQGIRLILISLRFTLAVLVKMPPQLKRGYVSFVFYCMGVCE